MSKEILGVIGGLGPIATAHFMALVTEMTDAVTDQQHLNMIIYSAPSIPDRTAHILDNAMPSPLPQMLSIGQTLTEQGCTRIAIPCMTAHYFFDALETGIPVPLVHGVRETVRHLKENGIKKVGIMATDGTIRSRIFRSELENQGMTALVPGEEAQRCVMHLIFNNIKAGIPAQMDNFHAAAADLRNQGAESIILGCTELSLIKRDHQIGPGFIDAMEVLAQQSVLQCGLPLKEEFNCLISI